MYSLMMSVTMQSLFPGPLQYWNAKHEVRQLRPVGVARSQAPERVRAKRSRMTQKNSSLCVHGQCCIREQDRCL